MGLKGGGADGTEYVIDGDGLTDEEAMHITREMFAVLWPRLTWAECDLPWHRRDEWPEDVRSAAERLHAMLPADDQRKPYAMLPVTALDDANRDDFFRVAPYTYDATFGGDDGCVVDLNDENTSNVWRLNPREHARLCQLAGTAHVYSLRDWHELRRSRTWLGRLRNRLTGGRG